MRLAIYIFLFSVGPIQVTKLRWPKLGVEGYHIPGLKTTHYVEPGDIYIVFYLRLSDGKNEDLLCNNVSINLSPDYYPFSQGAWWAVNKINTERLISPNLKLGFVVIDSCVTNSFAMKIQSLPLLPTTDCIVINGSVCSSRLDSGNGSSSDLGHLVAVVNNAGSTQNVDLSGIFRTFLIPIVSMMASSDQLSPDSEYPYFSRVIPTDIYQMKAVYAIIKSNGWAYVSVLYEAGAYGEKAFGRLKQEFNDDGRTCMAAVIKVPEDLTQEIADQIVDSLVKQRNARIVVAILGETHIIDICKSLRRNSVDSSHFLWIFSDSVSNMTLDDWGRYLEGSFFVDFYSTNVPEFDEWFLKRKPRDATGDPWFRRAYEHFCNCSFMDGTCDDQAPIGSCNTESRSRYFGLLYDAIYAVANATARVLNSSDCPLERDWKECLTGPRVLREIRQTRQEGVTGWLELTQNGDRLSSYVVIQVIRNRTASTPNVFYTVLLAQFDIASQKLLLERNFSWPNDSPIRSFCSSPCQDDEVRILHDNERRCCWVCHRCEVNQVIDRNLSTCTTCALLYWPSDKKDNCDLIPHTHYEISNLSAICQILFSSLTMVLCFAVAIFFYRYHDEKVIKASSIELSYIMLFGLIQGYMATIFIIVLHEVLENDDLLCHLYYLLYSTSLTLLYAPLLLRVFRIYRIFMGRIRSAKRNSYIQPFYLKVGSFLLCLIMIVIVLVSMVLDTEWASSVQPDRYQKYVEHGCNIPLTGLNMSFGYNLLLLAICSVLALKTRHLPENFNESGFICASVCTSFCCVLCFIPAYFWTNSVIMRLLVLNTVISITHTVNFYLLFVTRVYAVLFVTSDEIRYLHSSLSGTATLVSVDRRKSRLKSTCVDPKLRGRAGSSLVDRRKSRKGVSVSSLGDVKFHGVSSSHVARKKSRKGPSTCVDLKVHAVESSPVDTQATRTSLSMPEVSFPRDDSLYTGDPIWAGPVPQSPDSQGITEDSGKMNPAALDSPSEKEKSAPSEKEKSANINEGEEPSTSGPDTSHLHIPLGSLPAGVSVDTVVADDLVTVDIFAETITESRTAIRKWSHSGIHSEAGIQSGGLEEKEPNS